MRAYVPNYRVVSPSDLSEALSLIAREPDVWKPFAGGTDLMVLLEAGKLLHQNYLNIWNLNELRGIEVSDSHVTMGALTTYTQVQSHPVLQSEFGMLCQAASETGGLAIQNRGTVGGNIVNASPAADSPPALLAYDAELELASTGEKRWIPYHGFHTGYKQMTLRSDELLTRIRLPRPKRKRLEHYRKVGTRKAQAISKICFAGTAALEDGAIADVRIVFGSVAPVPLRCVETEAALRGQKINATTAAQQTLANEIVPIDDIRSTKNYRLQVSLNLLEDFLSRIASQA
ncbi:MAG TPA: xanthine dehydrogenase family protein subunit M [Pyrinomonadaceae bacterium]|nr:xanthine dehydrogenase family protein subunit M [Pyrinomonadaceae bacterium]